MNKWEISAEWFVKLLTWILDVTGGVIIKILDKVRTILTHAAPSLAGLATIALVFLAPAPVAYMTSRSAGVYFGWETTWAWVLALAIELLGFAVWLRLAEAVLSWVDSGRGRVSWLIVSYGLVALVYETILILLNVAFSNGEDTKQWALFLICLLPAMAAIVYGGEKHTAEKQIEKQAVDKAEFAERIRLEKRADRLEAKALKSATFPKK